MSHKERNGVRAAKPKPWEKTYVLLPSYEKVKADKVLYTHTSRILHHETNPGCVRALMQKHGDRYIWINPPAIPLSTEEMDSVFALPYQRVPHPCVTQGVNDGQPEPGCL